MSEPVHVRSIQVGASEAVPDGDAHQLRVHGVLEDRRPRGIPSWIAHDGEVIHRMEVTLTVRYPDFVITAVDGLMTTVPHPEFCPDAVPPLQSLVGVSVARGFVRAVNERLGRERGCTHVVALILAMGPVVRQAAGAAFGFGRAGGTRGPGDDLPWFVNSCQAWRENGPLHVRWRARAIPED